MTAAVVVETDKCYQFTQREEAADVIAAEKPGASIPKHHRRIATGACPIIDAVLGGEPRGPLRPRPGMLRRHHRPTYPRPRRGTRVHALQSGPRVPRCPVRTAAPLMAHRPARDNGNNAIGPRFEQ